MALTVKELNEFSKNTSLTQVQMKALYKALVEEHGKELVDINFISQHVKKLNILEYSLQEYIQEDFHKLDLTKPEKVKSQMSPQEIQDEMHKAMNAKTAGLARIKLGYSKSNWKKVEKYEKMMRDWLTREVPRFLSDMVALNISPEDDASVELFLKYENNWKSFCRANIINKYPGSEKSTGDLRSNIMNLFATKVRELMGKQK